MRYFDIVYRRVPDRIELYAPIIINEIAIIKDNVDNEILLRNIFSNIGNVKVVAISIWISLQDIFGEDILEEETNYVYADISFEAKEMFGNKIPIKLPPNARKAEVRIDRIVLEDGDVWNTNKENIVQVQIQHDIQATSEFMETLDDNTIPPIFYFIENEMCWQCTCGQPNKQDVMVCTNCKRLKKMVQFNYSKAVLDCGFKDFLEKKEALLKIEQENKREIELEKRQELVANNNENLGEQIKRKKGITKIRIMIGGVIGALALTLIIALGISRNSEDYISKQTLEYLPTLFGRELINGVLTVNQEESHYLSGSQIFGLSGDVDVKSITHSNKVQYVYWHSNDECSDLDYKEMIKALTEFYGITPEEDKNYNYRWEFENMYAYCYKNDNNVILVILASIDEDDWI